MAPKDSQTPTVKPRGRRKSTISHIAIDQRVTLTLNEHEKVTIGEFTDRVGFGSYQMQVFFMSFGALMVESAVIAMVAACVEPISQEFQVEGAIARAGFTGMLYLGIQIGTVVVGCFVDRYGRRRPLLTGYCGMVVFGVICCFAPGVKVFYAMVFMMGLFGGLTVPCAIILLSEVVPLGLRGTCSAALGVAFRVGSLWSSVALWIWMPQLDAGPWRWMVGAAILPAAIFLTFCLVSPAARQETPHYLAIAGQGRALVSTLNLMADTNHRQDLRLVSSGEVRLEKQASSVTLREVLRMMLTHPLYFHFLIMVVLFFCKEFVAGGTTAYWPVTFAHLHKHAPDVMEAKHKARPVPFPHTMLAQTLVASGFIDHTGLSAAAELVITSLLGFPGIAVAMWAMHLLDRRVSITVGAGLTGIGGLLLLCLYGSLPVLGIVGVALIQLFFPIWQMTTMLLASEIFPTQVRGQAYSTSYFIGRFGSEVAQLAVQASPAVFPVITACLAVTALSLVYLLPETKDQELTNFVSKRSTNGKAASSYGAADSSSGAAADGKVEKAV